MSINRARGSGGHSEPLSREKTLGSEEHLDWLKIDLNAPKIK